MAKLDDGDRDDDDGNDDVNNTPLLLKQKERQHVLAYLKLIITPDEEKRREGRQWRLKIHGECWYWQANRLYGPGHEVGMVDRRGYLRR